jgi:glycosyltransferase involved in cell wall biosynthesis
VASERIRSPDQRSAGAEPLAADPELVAALEFPLRPLPVGRPSAIFLYGHCFHRRQPVVGLEVVVDGRGHRPTAWGMPRPDLPSYRSAFWATIPIAPARRPGPIEIEVAARLAGGRLARAPVGTLEAVAPSGRSARVELPGGDGTIAICMATFDPPLELLRIQLSSIRAQTDGRWICLISDDCSSPERFAGIVDAVGDDPRFVVSRSERRIGFYRNFERALGMVPPGIELVALCDQDDRWYPEKLATLRAALGDAQLVYSDMRLVDVAGRVVSESLWEGRRNNHTNLASLLVANTVAGAASLFRREVLERALPFPHGPGWEFHDHWLGLVALAAGRVGYVDRPLYDYVQHAGAILGQVAVDGESRGAASRSRRRRASLRGALGRWRAAYFRVYLQLQLQAEVLLARTDSRLTARKRRALRLLIAAERSPLAFAWLVLRPLRRWIGRDETLGAEATLARGIVWRWLVAARAARRTRPGRWGADASLPPFDLKALEQRRMRRWRARR